MTETRAPSPRPVRARPWTRLGAVLVAAALCACDRAEPPTAANPAPFVEGLEAAGFAKVRFGGIRRDGGTIVLSGVEATRSGRPVSAREVRFENVRALRPLAVGRVVVTGLDAGHARADRVETGEFHAAGFPPVGAAFVAEGVEGRLAGRAFRAARLAREASAPGGAAAFRFAGLESDAPPLSGRKDWEGTASIGADPATGAVRLAATAMSGEARIGLEARLDGHPPGTGPDALAAWPFAPDEGRWEMASLRGLAFRSEGLAAPGLMAGAAPGGPAAAIAEGLAKGVPVAVAYDPTRPVPAGIAWSTLLSADGAVPGLRVRAGDAETHPLRVEDRGGRAAPER